MEIPQKDMPLEPPKPPETPEEKYKKIEVIGKINSYLRSTFGEYLQDFKDDYKGKTLAECEDALLDIKYTVQCHENTTFNFEGFLALSSISEMLLIKNGVNAKGITDVYKKNKQIPRLIERIALERELSMKPEYQLALLCIMNAKIVIDTNNRTEEMKKITINSKKRPSKDIQEKYKDLD